MALSQGRARPLHGAALLPLGSRPVGGVGPIARARGVLPYQMPHLSKRFPATSRTARSRSSPGCCFTMATILPSKEAPKLGGTQSVCAAIGPGGDGRTRLPLTRRWPGRRTCWRSGVTARILDIDDNTCTPNPCSLMLRVKCAFPLRRARKLLQTPTSDAHDQRH